jgi:hypothetical protein
VREIDDLPATVWWEVQVRQSILHIAQCIARVQESCAALRLTEMSTRNLPVGKGRPARGADNLTAFREPIVQKM